MTLGSTLIHQNTALPQYISTAYCGLARIALLHDKNQKEAKEFSEEGLRQRPADTQILKFLALADYQLGEKKEALQVAKRLYEVLPDQGSRLYIFIQNNKPMNQVDPLYGVNYIF